MRTDSEIRSDSSFAARAFNDFAVEGYWPACERLAADVPELLGRALRAETAITRVRDLARFLGSLAPGDQHYAQLILAALGDAVPTPTRPAATTPIPDARASGGSLQRSVEALSTAGTSRLYGPVPAPTQPAETPEPCGAKKNNCPCRLPAGHERDHACAHGYWIG